MVNFDVRRQRNWKASVLGKVRTVPAEYLRVVGKFKGLKDTEEIFLIQGRVKKQGKAQDNDSDIEIIDASNPEELNEKQRKQKEEKEYQKVSDIVRVSDSGLTVEFFSNFSSVFCHEDRIIADQFVYSLNTFSLIQTLDHDMKDGCVLTAKLIVCGHAR